jgi:hypothetical protein
MAHCVVEPDGIAQVAVNDSIPVENVLLPQRQIEPVLMTQGTNVSRGGAVAEHLQNWITWNEVNEQKDQRHYQPDNRECKGEANQNLLHWLRLTINQPAPFGVMVLGG